MQDLDELLLRCRDARAQTLAKEAIDSYRAGAYRASIVTMWISVVFDVISKIREVAFAGDAAAKAEIERLDSIISSHNLPQAQKFENDTLEIAYRKFEFISKHEFDDLERLHADRQRCAHPSLVNLEEEYSPPPELARLHIRNAITILLSQPPTQGRAALERLIGDVASPMFPVEVAAARRLFDSSALFRPKIQLTKNFVAALTASLLGEELSFKQSEQRIAALNASIQMHNNDASSTVKEKIRGRTLPLETIPLYRATRFLARIDSAFELATQDFRDKALQYINDFNPEVQPRLVHHCLRNPEMIRHIRLRIRKFSADEMTAVIKAAPHKELADSAIGLFSSAIWKKDILRASETLSALEGHFNKSQFEHILVLCERSTYIHNLDGFSNILSIFAWQSEIDIPEVRRRFIAAGVNPTTVDENIIPF